MTQFYVAVGAVIERDDKFLLLKRSPEKDFKPGVWEIVTGRLEREEQPVQGVLREVEEEVGLTVKVVMPIHTTFFYRGSKEFPMVFITYWCRHLDGDVSLSWEHSEFKWVTMDDALEIYKDSPFFPEFANLKKLKQHLPTGFQLDWP